MSHAIIPFWKKAPFFRILLPLAAGILLQWNLALPLYVPGIAACSSLLLLLIWQCLYPAIKFRLRLVPAALVFFLLSTGGALLLFLKDVRNHHQWIGHMPLPDPATGVPSGAAMILTVTEPPVEKMNSLKCMARAVSGSSGYRGLVYLYLEKDSSFLNFTYGTRLLVRKPLARVVSTGNPRAFDYARYSLFQGITHQVYLKKAEVLLLPPGKAGPLKRFLPWLQRRVLSVIRKYIPGKKEAGLAEALLIGYKQDLDPELVASYTNTGLAHVIAISGMHLALIYWILMLVFHPLEKRKGFRYIAPLLTITLLWVFTFLAGAQPSVLRSAVMFSCIITGRTISRSNPL